MHKKESQGIWKHLDFVLLDVLGIVIAYLIAFSYRTKTGVSDLNEYYRQVVVILMCVAVAVSLLGNGYKDIIHRTKFMEILATIRYVSIVEIIFLFILYFTRMIDLYSRIIFAVSWAIAMVLVYVLRVLWKLVVRKFITKKSRLLHMLVISTGDRYEKCIRNIYAKPYRTFDVRSVAFLDENAVEGSPDQLKISGMKHVMVKGIYGSDALMEYVRQQVVDEIYIEDVRGVKALDELVDLFLSMGITVHIGTGYLPENLPNQMVQKIGREVVVTTSGKMEKGWKLAVKRAIDILAGLAGLVVTGILALILWPIVKIKDPGPLLFKQKRMGRNGRTFYMYKFRSMYMDAEERKKELMEHNEMQGLMFKMENDPRIIGSEKGPGKGYGNFIRKTSIDEFPQFINVLKGDMSLVGTRPPTVDEFHQYDLHHKVRLAMKPGITGMWQVSGRNEITDFEEVVKLDTEYIENWSLALDLKIIFKTVGTVIQRKGSK